MVVRMFVVGDIVAVRMLSLKCCDAREEVRYFGMSMLRYRVRMV